MRAPADEPRCIRCRWWSVWTVQYHAASEYPHSYCLNTRSPFAMQRIEGNQSCDRFEVAGATQLQR